MEKREVRAILENDGDRTFYTVTMAKVYADQGRFDEAAGIYRYLLDQTPDRTDLQKALAEVSANLPEVPRQWQDVSPLVERWVTMILSRNRLEQLQRTALAADRPEW